MSCHQVACCTCVAASEFNGAHTPVVEYARSVATIADAVHAENDPPTGSLLITPVACPVPERAPDAPALSAR